MLFGGAGLVRAEMLRTRLPRSASSHRRTGRRCARPADDERKNRHAPCPVQIFVGYRWHEARRIAPLFAFGHGLSYTTFEYGNLRADRRTLHDNGALRISVDITNTGDRAGQEVVQLYIGDETSTLPRPVKELKGFRKILLDSGETGTVTFAVTPEQLACYDDSEQAWVVEPGVFTASIGASSQDIRTQIRFEYE